MTLVWIGLILLLVIVEIYTIANKKRGDTLSEQVWRMREWLKGKGFAGQTAWALFVWALIGFFGWLVLHLVLPGSV